MPRYYPMMMDLKGRTCVVVGGGEVAARKVTMLINCDATVKMVAPKVDRSLDPLITAGRLIHVNAPYEKDHIKGAALVVASTDNGAVNRAVYRDAAELGVPVNVVDVPELSSFIVPAVAERGDLIVAISTSGKSPAMAKRIRKELQNLFGEEYSVMLNLMGEIRQLLMEREPDVNRRMKLLNEIVNSNLMDRIKAGERPGAKEIVEGALAP